MSRDLRKNDILNAVRDLKRILTAIKVNTTILRTTNQKADYNDLFIDIEKDRDIFNNLSKDLNRSLSDILGEYLNEIPLNLTNEQARKEIMKWKQNL